MPVIGIPVNLLLERIQTRLDREDLVTHLQHLGCDVEGYATVRRFRCTRCDNVVEITETENPPILCDRCGCDFKERPEAQVALGESDVIRMELLAVRPETRVLFMSGYAAEGVLREVSDLASASMLLKPFTPTSLGRKLNEVLEAGTRQDEKSGPASGGGPALRVLHMDDDRDILEITGRLLGRAGHEVVSCENVDEAVARYGEALAAGRRFDVVLLDLSIPGRKGGVEAMKELLALDPAARIFACSGAGPAEAGPPEKGFLALVEKPFTPECLDTIRRLL